MDLNVLKNNLPTTPAYIFDESKIVNNLQELVDLKKLSGCSVLYSIKALPLSLVLQIASHYLDGFSVSSLFEARLAKEVLGDKGSIHLTTPGLRENEFEEIVTLCSHISFNSISQYQRMPVDKTTQVSAGLRVNPKLSFANDIRFDPCRPFSKLGADIDLIDSLPKGMEGLHFHTVFSSTHYRPLVETVTRIKQKWGEQLAQLKWINLGGGYLYQQINQHQPLIEIVKQLKVDYDVDVYIEPGKAIVGNAGYLATTVIDRFARDGKEIAVLDTSVNHNPEVFEYQRKPNLLEEENEGGVSCNLVGSSCLAGDVFGEYQFNQLPVIGDRLVFLDVGAYSLIKANRFNGYNLPDIYSVDEQKKIKLIKQSSYQNYREQWI